MATATPRCPAGVDLDPHGWRYYAPFVRSEPIRQVLTNGSVVRAVLGFSAFTIVLHGSWLAAIVYAFDQGGAAEVGALAVGVQVPAALLSPFVAVFADRFPPNRSLAAGFFVQGAALIGAAAAAVAGATRFSVYVLLGILVIAQMASRPTVSAMLPRIVTAPAELAAANSAIGLVETCGLVAGPALVGLILFLTASEIAVFVAMGIALVVAAALAATINVTTSGLSPDEARTDSIRQEVAGGFSLLRSDAAARRLVVLMASMKIVVGVLEVGVVVIAIERLQQGEAMAGLLATAIGVGAIAGSALSFLLVTKRQWSPWIGLGVLCASAPVALVAATKETLVVVALMAVAGLGRPLVGVGGRTLLQGLSTDDMLARVFGVLEGLSLLCVAIGSALFAVLNDSISVEAALIVSAAIPCLVTVVLFPKLRTIDAQRTFVDTELLLSLRRIPIFAPLAPFQVEQIAMNMRRWTFGSNAAVFDKGDDGDLLYVVTEGWAHIDLDDAPVGAGRGGFFGEIALLRDQPRMASVRAGSAGLTAYALDRETFLSAVSAVPLSKKRTEEIVAERLGESD